MENYKNRPLVKPVAANIISQQTWKCATKSDIVWQNWTQNRDRVQELCKSQGGRHGLSVLMSLTVTVDIKQHWTLLRHWSQFVPNMSTDIRGHEALHHHHHHHHHQNRVVQSTKGIIHKAGYFCTAAVSYQTWTFKTAQGPSKSRSREFQGPP